METLHAYANIYVILTHDYGPIRIELYVPFQFFLVDEMDVYILHSLL